MANFPTLKTGAIAQYPSDRTVGFSTNVYRFLDGSEQRFPAFDALLRRWSIRLDLLDEAELYRLETFFTDQEGRAESFSFTDPWDGSVYPNCSFDINRMTAEFRGQGESAATVIVKENR